MGYVRSLYGHSIEKVLVEFAPLPSLTPQQAYLYALDAQSRLPARATPVQRDLAALQRRQARGYLEYLGLTAPQIAAPGGRSAR